MLTSPSGSTAPSDDEPPPFLLGGGALGTLIAKYDWSDTPLGALSTWPPALRAAVGIVLHAPQPAFLAYGFESTLIANGACRSLLRLSETAAFAKPAADALGPLWSSIGQDLQMTAATRAPSVAKDVPVFIEDEKGSRETYHNFSFTALGEATQRHPAVLCLICEETERVVSQHRLEVLRELAMALADARTEEGLARTITDSLQHNQQDLPFTLIYLFEAEQKAARLVAASGIPPGHAAAPLRFDVLADAAPWPAEAILKGASAVRVAVLPEAIDRATNAAWTRLPVEAELVTIARPGGAQPVGFLVAGINPCRPFDAGYEGFVRLIGSLIGSGFANSDANKELHTRSAALQAVLETVPTAVLFTADPEAREIRGNRQAALLLRLDGPDLNVSLNAPDGERLRHFRLFQHGAELLPGTTPLSRAARGEEVAGEELEIRFADGGATTLLIEAKPLHDADGKLNGAVAGCLDITSIKRTEEALRGQSRTLETLNRTGALLSAELDLNRLIQAVTEAATELSGAQFGTFFYNVPSDKDAADLEALSTFPIPRSAALFDDTFKRRTVVRADDIRKDARYGTPGAEANAHAPGRIVASYLAVPVVSRSGDVLGGLFFGHEEVGVFTEETEKIVAGIAAQAAIAIDNARLFKEAQVELTRRRQMEEHQNLLLAELNHRVKNTLAAVQSIAAQTLHHAPSPAAFRESFEARLMALSQAHNLLTKKSWQGASLQEMVHQVLAPYASEDRQRYTVRGPKDIEMSPKAAVALVMAFHELATNAAKYGALHSSSGMVEVTWRTMVEEKGRGLLRLDWTETGGEPVVKPSRRGFGSLLIERGIAHELGGEVALSFLPEGIRCTMMLPVQVITGSDRV